MKLTEQRKGELYAFAELALLAQFPIIAVLSYKSLPPLISLGWSAVFAAAFMGAWVVWRGYWREIGKPAVWKQAVITAFWNGLLFHGFYFIALEFTTPGNAVLIALLNALTNFLFFNVFRGEKIQRHYLIGTAFMLLGGAIVLAPNFSGVNIGDFLVVLAICCTPIGNLALQRGREVASAETLLFLRNLLMVPMVFAAAYFFGAQYTLPDVEASLVYLLINGVLVLAISKVFFVEAIKRISVPKTSALETAAPIATLITAWILLGQVPTFVQLLAFIPLALGVLFLTDQLKLSNDRLPT